MKERKTVMNAMNRKILHYTVIALMTILPVLAYAVALPEATFQSTSVLAGSGSAFSSTPMLKADGTATYQGDTSPVRTSGPRKIAPPTSTGDPTPLGDVLLPLLLMALAYAGYVKLKTNTK